MNLTSFSTGLLQLAANFNKEIIDPANRKSKYYFPNEPSEVRRNSHDAVRENILFGVSEYPVPGYGTAPVGDLFQNFRRNLQPLPLRV